LNRPFDRDKNFTGFSRCPFFLIVDAESILGEEEVWSRQARVTGRTGHKF
jgi:hypothetical protein